MKRKTFRLIHLYLGLVSGLVVFVVAVTGCCWVFQEEIKALTEEKLVVQQRDTPLITPSQVKAIASAEIPKREIHGVLYPADLTSPIEVIFYEADPEFYYSLFLDPFTGQILRKQNNQEGFFAFVLEGHLYLWLPHAIGKQVVSYSTLCFLFSLITGIVLWWPKKKKGRKQRFKFDWKVNTGWRRKNFDLHTVVGFYISSFGIVFAVTGLVMALPWFYFLYYVFMGGDSEMRFVTPNNESGIAQVEHLERKPIDELPDMLYATYPEAISYEIHYPHVDSASILVEVANSEGLFYDMDFRFYDQNTLTEISTPSIYGVYADADLQDNIMRMNYDIHIGAILGLPGKILMFLASLIVASLPVTGILLWVGRKRKEKEKREVGNSAPPKMPEKPVLIKKKVA